jgi:hypothetical protein
MSMGLAKPRRRFEIIASRRGAGPITDERVRRAQKVSVDAGGSK